MAAGDLKFVTFPINFDIDSLADTALTDAVPATVVAGHTFVSVLVIDIDTGNNGVMKTRAIELYTED